MNQIIISNHQHMQCNQHNNLLYDTTNLTIWVLRLVTLQKCLKEVEKECLLVLSHFFTLNKQDKLFFHFKMRAWRYNNALSWRDVTAATAFPCQYWWLHKTRSKHLYYFNLFKIYFISSEICKRLTGWKNLCEHLGTTGLARLVILMCLSHRIGHFIHVRTLQRKSFIHFNFGSVLIDYVVYFCNSVRYDAIELYCYRQNHVA